MSLLYSLLKPIVRKKVKGGHLHKEESYEEFKKMSYDVQSKFRFSLPKIRGFEFRDEQLDGFHVNVVGNGIGTAAISIGHLYMFTMLFLHIPDEYKK